MEYIVKIKSLNYKDLFNNLNLNIKKGSFTSIVGKNGCGKSTLIKIMVGLIKNIDGSVEIDNEILNKNSLKKIGIVFDNPNNNFIGETPHEDMNFLLKNMGYNKEIDNMINENAQYFNIQNILDCSINNLSGGEKQLVALATVSLINPSIIILDDALTMIDGITKEKILKILKKLNKEKKTTVIYVTHDIEDVLYGTDLVIINDRKIFVNDKLVKLLEDEKIFKKSGLELPFMASLSLKLKYYGLIDKLVLDMDKMVNLLWK